MKQYSSTEEDRAGKAPCSPESCINHQSPRVPAVSISMQIIAALGVLCSQPGLAEERFSGSEPLQMSRCISRACDVEPSPP